MIGKRFTRKFLAGIFAALVSSLLLGGAALAAEFSADMVMKSPDGETMAGKVFVKAGKIRQEFDNDGEKMVTILRPDKKLSWVLMVEEKAYMEMKMKPSAEDPALVEKADPVKVKRLGNETVNGFVCEKIQVTEGSTVITQWLSKELGWPLKGEVKAPEGVSTHEYKNIRKGNVADSLFELPSGYQKMALPGM